MLFPELTRFTDLGLLLLRLMIALVFGTSGWKHLKKPAERSKSIGMSKGFTIFLGVAESLGSLGVAVGVLTQLAAFGLILIMRGGDSEENFCVAYRVLGKQRMELRSDAGGHEPRYCFHRRRPLRPSSLTCTRRVRGGIQKYRRGGSLMENIACP